jgi:hypothetical protein
LEIALAHVENRLKDERRSHFVRPHLDPRGAENSIEATRDLFRERSSFAGIDAGETAAIFHA